MTTPMVRNTVAPSPPQSLRSAAYVWVAPRWVLALLSTFLGPLAGMLRRSRQELWDGGDHLLVVEHTGYREHYRRIRYDAIQAWTVRPTADFLVTSLMLGAIIALWTLIALSMGIDAAMGAWFFRVAAGGYSLVLLIHLALGPTVCVRLHTAVQTLEIPAAGRRRTWQRVRRHLIDRITAAQGTWNPDDWLSHTDRTSYHVTQDPPPTPSTPNISGPPAEGMDLHPPRPDRRAHFILSGCCLLDPLTSAWSLSGSSLASDVVGISLMVLALTMAGWAIRNQRHGPWPKFLRRLPWLAMAVLAIALVAGMVIGVLLVMGGFLSGNPAEIDNWDPMASPPMMLLVVGVSAFNVVLGILGFLGLKRWNIQPPLLGPHTVTPTGLPPSA